MVAETSFGLAYEGPPGYLHGGMSGLVMDQVLGAADDPRRALGDDRPPRAGLPRAGAAGHPVVLRGRVTEAPGARRSSPARSPWPPSPDSPLVEARGVFVTPRPEKIESYFAGVTDASGGTDTARPAGGRDRAPAGGDDRAVSDVEVAVAAARAAADVLLDLRAGGLTGRELGDAGDAAAQRAIADVLAAQRPDDVVFSEEAADDRRRLAADRVWIVDPLDGTREYGEPGRARLGGARGAVGRPAR